MIKRYCDICGKEIDTGHSNIYYLSLSSTTADDWNLDVCENCFGKLKLPNVKIKLKELVNSL